MLLGAHESVAGGVFTALERGAANGCEAVQIFARPSQQWRARPFAPDEVSLFRSEQAALGCPVFSHGSYLINLCAPDPVVLEKSRAALEDEMLRAEQLGLGYVIVHPGAHMGAGVDEGIRAVIATVAWLHERTRGFTVRLALEITAGQGSCLGCRFDEMARMLDGAPGGDRLGICFDTCHALAAGYDLTTDEGYDATFAELDRAVGLERLVAFHLNDSKTPRGSRVDRHQEIGKGHLGLLPFWRLVNDARFAKIPAVLELPPAVVPQNLTALRALRGAPRPQT